MDKSGDFFQFFFLVTIGFLVLCCYILGRNLRIQQTFRPFITDILHMNNLNATNKCAIFKAGFLLVSEKEKKKGLCGGGIGEKTKGNL